MIKILYSSTLRHLSLACILVLLACLPTNVKAQFYYDDYYYADENPNELLLIEAWESKEHQQIHIGQPHMAKLREFRNDYIAESKLGEFELK